MKKLMVILLMFFGTLCINAQVVTFSDSLTSIGAAAGTSDSTYLLSFFNSYESVYVTLHSMLNTTDSIKIYKGIIRRNQISRSIDTTWTLVSLVDSANAIKNVAVSTKWADSMGTTYKLNVMYPELIKMITSNFNVAARTVYFDVEAIKPTAGQ